MTMHRCPMCGGRCYCKNEDGPGVECEHDCAGHHADVLEDYAHNCPAEIDGGPGIEDSLCAGAEALRAGRRPKS